MYQINFEDKFYVIVLFQPIDRVSNLVMFYHKNQWNHVLFDYEYHRYRILQQSNQYPSFNRIKLIFNRKNKSDQITLGYLK